MGSYLPSSALSHISYISHADLSVHSSLLNHSSSSPAHHERRPLRQAEEQPEGFTDTNSASLKAWPAVYITPFTLLPKGLKTELMDSTCPDVIDIDTWAIAMSRYYQQHFCNVLTTATLCSKLTIRPRDCADYTNWTASAITGITIFIHPSHSKRIILNTWASIVISQDKKTTM